MMLPERKAADADRAKIRPVRKGSWRRNSETYLVAVKPKPRPAKIPNMPAVLWIIPSAPKPSLPRNRAQTTDAAKKEAREITAPKTDQKAPAAKRARSDPAGANSRCLATIHVWSDVVIREQREDRNLNYPIPPRRNA